MYLLLLLLALLPMALLSARAAEAAPVQDLEIENLDDSGELVNDLNTRTWVGHRGVIVKDGETVLIADEVRLNEATREVVADGHVILQGRGIYWTGQHLEYNFNTREIRSGSYRAGVSGAFMSAESLVGTTLTRSYEAEKATITTEDVDDPLFYVRAKKVRVTNQTNAEIEHATFYIGSLPYFYLPYYQRNLTTHRAYVSLQPGIRSEFGPFLLTHYHYRWRTNLDFGVNLDYRAQRGPAIGPDVHYDLGKFGKGEFHYYFAPDSAAHDDPALLAFSEERQRLRYSHLALPRPDLAFRADVNYESDPRFIRDFFEGEYRQNPSPTTTFEGSKFWRNFSLSALVEPRVNDFYPTIERLPDLKLSALRQQLGGSPIFYEGESSLAYLRNNFGAFGGTNYVAGRGDSFHQLLVPRAYFGWLNVSPRAGVRLTHYTESDEFGAPPLSEESRFVFNTGLDATFKASRVFPGARSRLLDVTELRHIIEPSINYVFVPAPNDRPRELPQFDFEIPSLRLLPIDFPDYNRIDSIDSQNVIRIGARNKWQTKRDDYVDTLANWLVVTDWRLNPRPGQSTFSDIYSDLEFRPRQWLTFNSELRFDVHDTEFNLASHFVTIQPQNFWRLQLGHRYFAGEPALGPGTDNNIIYTAASYRFNENWSARFSHHFEARNGTLQEQYYTVYRDFRSWTGALTLRLRDRRDDRIDYALAFTISLKHNPRDPQRGNPEYMGD